MIGHIFSARLRIFTCFVLAYFIGFLIAAISMGNYEFIFYEMAMALIIAAIVFMDRRVEFSRLTLCGLALWGLLHLSGGIVPIPPEYIGGGEENPTAVLYNLKLAAWLPKYDQFVHAMGFGFSAIAAHEALQSHFKCKLPINFQIGSILFFMALGLGCLNEIIEFIAVLSIPNTNVGGYYNTGWDMISNATGALIAILYLRIRQGV